ncbi:Importin-beta, N-terminal domain-containing protein [Trypanosoma theileri]|uniref:Importin-beta, N-terminal domain-containing protein n=1 Tax=Trypanosoma theileri TaxID=67003 RepID=A0A1X0NQX8_9TRYP|nr:Importin-beta, N-terminal domain-containing protein [Trypanosoma theileri]ORC86938.1 Importin-beta, N-terminal domain-containing protein [Trypanosoma theileri]
MSNWFDSIEGVECFSTLLYNGDKSALETVTDLGWPGLASAMGSLLMQQVLQQSESAYSIFFVTQVLRHLVDSQFTTSDLVALEAFLSCVIVQRHTLLTPVCVDALIRLLCTAVIRGFCDAPELQNFPHKVLAALMLKDNRYSEEHVSLSCSILITLIDEIENMEDTVRGLVTHKRVNVCFRNESLLPMFRAVSHCIKHLHCMHEKANYSAVTLLGRVLLFDFNSSCSETVEDMMTREFPQEWANDLIDQQLMMRLWELYTAPTGDSRFFAALLDALTPLVSIKSTLYPSQQVQSNWLGLILSATLSIMESRIHLEEAPVLREFCRLLNRIKPNFTIDEMRKSSCYERWIRTTCEFTKLCFQNWCYARQAFLSLTSIWAKLVGSQSYCKDGQTFFEELAPEVCISYIMSNKDQAVRFATQRETVSFDDYILDADAETISLEFDFASQLLRFCGEKVENYFLQELQSLLSLIKTKESLSDLQISCTCECLAWNITFASSWLNAYRFSRSGRVLDSSILISCFDVVRESSQASFTHSVSIATRRHFHKSLLIFLRTAWHILLLDRLDDAKKLREQLRDYFSLTNQDVLGRIILGIVVDEVMDCVRTCADDTVIEALDLLSEMAQSPSTAVILKTLPQFNTNLVLNMERPQNLKGVVAFHRVRYRLSRIEAQVHFLGSTLEYLSTEFLPPLLEELKKWLMAGIMAGDPRCDMLTNIVCSWRGVFRSCVGQTEYKMFLKNVFSGLPLITEQLQRHFGTTCGLQLLRLINEITENRYRRINFGPNGVEGYSLFRYVSDSLGMAVNMVEKALESGDSSLEEWGIKCLRIVLRTGRNILTGGYCNLGVLRLYEEKTLMLCLTALWRSMLLVNRNRLCQFEKLAQAYLMLAGELLRDLYLWFLSVVPVNNILSTIQLLEFSLGYHVSNKTSLASLSCEALGAFTGTLCQIGEEDTVHSERICSNLLQADPALFSRLIRLTIDVIVSRKCSSSTTEFLLRNLIVLDKNSFVDLASKFAGFAITNDKDAEVRAVFELLGSSAFESIRKNNNTLFAKEFQHFSTVVTSCLR